MDDLDTPNVLAVGAKLANLHRAKATHDVDVRTGLVEVETGAQAFELMRAVKFDLVAVGPGVSDMAPRAFAQRLQRARPWQKWVLVADETLAAEDECVARALGALAVLDGPDAWKAVVELARVVRRRHPATVVPHLRVQSAAM